MVKFSLIILNCVLQYILYSVYLKFIIDWDFGSLLRVVVVGAGVTIYLSGLPLT